MTNYKLRAAIAAGVAISALIAIPVLATPGSGFGPPATLSENVFGPIHASAHTPGTFGVVLNSSGNMTVGIDKLVVQPGGQSGWHTHTGLVLVSVTKGSLWWTDGSTCQTTIYPVGSSFVEQEDHVHLVRNLTDATAEFTGIQLRPAGTLGRINADAPAGNCGL